MSSRLVHVIVVPTGTVSVPGPKLKLSIFTSAVSGFCWALAVKFPAPAPSPAIPNPNATNKTAVDTLLLMVLLLFLFCIWTSENSCLCLVDFHTSEESVTASASQYCFRQNDFIGEIHCSRPKLVNGSENRCSFIFDKKYDELRWFRLTRVTAYGMNVFR